MGPTPRSAATRGIGIKHLQPLSFILVLMTNFLLLLGANAAFSLPPGRNNVTPGRVESVRSLYDTVDIDSDGCICFSEFKAALRRMSLVAPEDQWQSVNTLMSLDNVDNTESIAGTETGTIIRCVTPLAIIRSNQREGNQQCVCGSQFHACVPGMCPRCVSCHTGIMGELRLYHASASGSCTRS